MGIRGTLSRRRRVARRRTDKSWPFYQRFQAGQRTVTFTAHSAGCPSASGRKPRTAAGFPAGATRGFRRAAAWPISQKRAPAPSLPIRRTRIRNLHGSHGRSPTGRALQRPADARAERQARAAGDPRSLRADPLPARLPGHRRHPARARSARPARPGPGARRRSRPGGGVRRGALAAEDCEAVEARAVTEALLEVFLWKDIRFTLDESMTAAPAQATRPMNVDHLVMEAARRQDEAQHMGEGAGSAGSVWKPGNAGLLDAAVLPGVHRLVLETVDGFRGVPEIAGASGLPVWNVQVAVRALVEGGWIARLGPEELVEAADAQLAKRRQGDAIRLYHAALRNDRANVTGHARLAEASAAQGRIAKAAAHWAFCAHVLRKTDRAREAIECLRAAWRLLPTRFP